MQPTTPGWVYVLVSVPRPDVVKIGRTTRDAGQRARELDGTGAYADFAPFHEAWSRAVPDCCAVEAAAHRMLARHRVRARRAVCRELFRVDEAEARRVVEAAADACPGRRTLTRRGAGPHRRPRRMLRSGRVNLGTAKRWLAGLLLLVAGWSLAEALLP